MRVGISKASGFMTAPPSKSMAHRHLICAALSEGTSVISNIDLSEDIRATLGCLDQLGASAQTEGSRITVHGCGLKVTERPLCIFNCNESGSTLRFFVPLAMLSDQAATFVGSRTLMSRPLSVYEDICREQGICLESVGGNWEVEGKLMPGTFTIPGNISSQFVTGLLFALPLLRGNSRIVITGNVESRPYIDMTLQILGKFGINVRWSDGNTLEVPGFQTYKACDSTVEGDFSNAAFFQALNVLGGDIEISGLDPRSRQGDKVCFEYLERLKGGCPELDISDCPDLGPVLMAVAAALNGAVFTGTRRLAIKESNRGVAMCEELAKFGVKTHMEENSIAVFKGNLHEPSEVLLGHNDHRIVMALVTLLTVTGGRIEGVRAVKKSLPDYFRRLSGLGIDIDFEGDADGLD